MNGIKCERRVYTDQLNTHSHPFAQLILPMQGNLYIETDHKKLILDEQHSFLLPPGCRHTFMANQSNEFLVLDIPKYMINQGPMDRMEEGKALFFDDRWKAIRFLLLQEIESSNGYRAVNSLFYYFKQFILEDNIPVSLRYIHEHFHEDITLDTLAAIEHYHTTYYSEWFKRRMNVSPMEYIQKLRLEKTKELLLNTDFSVLQIAQLVGYRHHSSLTRIFKEVEGITPSEYRRSRKEAK